MKHNDICHRCGLSRHWSRTCCTKKHFVGLYHASLDKKGKQIEFHTAVLEENTTKATLSIDIKNLDVLEFFKDRKGEIGHLIGGGVIGPEDYN